MTYATTDGERLSHLLHDAAAGRPPAPDGGITVIAGTPDGLAGILAFTGHHVVVGEVDREWVLGHLDQGDMSAPVAPTFVAALGAQLGRTFDNLDLVLAARVGTPTSTAAELERLVEVDPDSSHPRVERALRYRREVRAFTTTSGDGVVVIGRGLGSRWEISFEVMPSARGRGLGRRLASAAAEVVPAGEHVFVQVSPGNAASLRAILAAGGFSPIGAEILFPPV